MSQNDIVSFAIKEIREVSFSVDEAAEYDMSSPYQCHYHVTLRSIVSEESVILTLDTTFKALETGVVFMQGKSYTRFLIQNMKKYAKLLDGAEAVDLPDQLWVTFFSLSYSHARALLAKSAGGTKYSSVLMPLINPDIEFKKIFAKDLGIKES